MSAKLHNSENLFEIWKIE